MEVNEFIESGILELFVFGATSDAENKQVKQMAAAHREVRDEILSIEKAVITLSYSMAPYVSPENYQAIREKLLGKHATVVQRKSGGGFGNFIGWAAAVALLIGIGYLYMQLDASHQVNAVTEAENTKLKQNLGKLQQKNQQTETVLAVVRDENNRVIALAGQTAAPEAKAKIYWNKQTQTVFVDATGLPEPPTGMVYQVWSLLLSPALTPTSIGLLENFKTNDTKIFAVQGTADAQAFGITLEPAGGSSTPTMAQLYTLGPVGS